MSRQGLVALYGGPQPQRVEVHVAVDKDRFKVQTES